ncbi:methyltransferase domain-containing protein [uncultured Pseudodesulfovibrio sp.]|uniref:class I SAM-dependent methyltransferase n=1 Tax=uncultured Pseudodesulfovibrio sp. TaxID=2035858 RepID=UPI0029C65450|nr:methyltransferase domain-containing protein [uncultured Pseudodesulfovibrio sp.]
MTTEKNNISLNERFDAPDPGSRVTVDVEGRIWFLDRAADLEALWDQMDDADLGDDERVPYWAEVWPASVLLGRHILRNAELLCDKVCLDLGCGLGLTGMIASSVGAKVIAFDYEWPAVRFARHNTDLNNVPQPLWMVMDWRQPAVKPHAFDFIWGGDILYEKRFFEPLIHLFRHALKPGGKIWIGEPVRTVSRPVWDELRERGFVPEKLTVEKVALCGQNPTVNLWEITIP